ncbi:unnamed protein product [Clonostachys rosea f. rosea IK726]|uniref:Uncharacterized protein n=1 Tax=Clonostachys rosea f. rosea IK726 TaxID=1349383 RepID=A0ACA9TLJ9_BIOOC|nr:unnamed protein product [Clonostachys rosea f. rosea IK726]
MSSDPITETRSDPQEEEEQEEGDDYYSYEDDIIEKWSGIIKLIRQETRKAYSSSPTFDSKSPELFQTYWRGIFSKIEQMVLEDTSIPQYLTEPPMKQFTVRFFNEPDAMCCPCTLPDTEKSIHLRSEDGVTKEDLIRAVTRELYGDKLPTVFSAENGYSDAESSDENAEKDTMGKETKEQKEKESKKKENTEDGSNGALMYWSDWMSKGGKSPARLAYLHYLSDEQYAPEIIMYFSSYGNFNRRLEFVEKKFGKVGDF